MATGKDIFDLGLKHVGEKYSFGAIAPKDDAKYKGPWDCAEFASWIIYQLTGKLYGCANNNGNPHGADAYSGFWVRDARALGKIISINEAFATKGAFLLRFSGPDIIGHVAISDGKGGTVEAHSTKTGVITSVVTGRRWDMAVLVPGIDYTTNDIPDVKDQNKKPGNIIYRYTSAMMQGAAVRRIQRALGIARADGIFGPETAQAVRAFQKKKNLLPDGEVGPKTAALLGIEL